jgi:protein-tyrosine phosphatase
VPALSGVPGSMGLTFCPGKKHNGIYGAWDRDLEIDILAIKSWGADIWLNTMEIEDMVSVKIDPMTFENSINAANISYLHFPIIDGRIPDTDSEVYWKNILSPLLQTHLRNGKKILIHCRGGLGRTGTIAARLLVDLGLDSDDAISIVRNCREGAIENSIQEQWISKQ